MSPAAALDIIQGQPGARLTATEIDGRWQVCVGRGPGPGLNATRSSLHEALVSVAGRLPKPIPADLAALL